MFDDGIIKYSDDNRRRYLNDLLLLAAFVLAAGILFCLIRFTAKPGNFVRITVSLSDASDTERVFALDEDGYVAIEWKDDTPVFTFTKDDPFLGQDILQGYENRDINVVQILGMSARMTYSNCPEQICVHSRPVSKAGESIVCLPHGIVLTVTNINDEIDSEYDAVTW